MGQTKIKATQYDGGVDGWVEAGETWTYGSATTIKITGDKRDKYDEGMKIKITQSSTEKFFVIIGEATYLDPYTIITVHPYDSSTSVANSTISDPCYSMMDRPYGFPDTPKFSAYLSSDLTSISNQTLVDVVYDTESFDIGSNYNTSTGEFTAPISGYYECRGQITWKPDNMVDQKRLYIRLRVDDGGGYASEGTFSNVSSGAEYTTCAVESVKYLAKGDKVKFVAYHNCGVDTLEVFGNIGFSFTNIRLVE